MIVAIITGLIVGLMGLVLAYLVYWVANRVYSPTLANSKFHKVKVVSPDGGILPTHVYLDGKELKGVRSVKYEIDMDTIPTVTIEMVGKTLEVNGDVKYE